MLRGTIWLAGSACPARARRTSSSRSRPRSSASRTRASENGRRSTRRQRKRASGLPRVTVRRPVPWLAAAAAEGEGPACRSEEHTSELQSLRHLVCRLLLEKKKKKYTSREETQDLQA